MLSILPFLLIGLGLSLFIDDGDDSDDTSSGAVPDLDKGDGSGEDLLDYVEGLDLVVQTLDGDLGSAPLIGGEGDDTLNGGPDDDMLDGRGGDDQIVGDLGDDTITGGSGDDTLNGDGGADVIDGGDGADVIDGGTGADSIIGGSGNDSLFGSDGADTVLGGEGDDVLDGTAADNTQFTPTADLTPTTDEQTSQIGEDELDESEDPIIDLAATTVGNQLLDGGTGDDTLTGDQGDTLTGGEGVDSFIVDADVDAILEAVLITDFDPTTETLTLNIDGLDIGDPTEDGFAFDLETNDLADDSGMEVVLQGVVVATLAGVSEADDITISIVGENTGTANHGTFSNLGDGDDTALGTASDDTVNGGDGNDSIAGSDGRDVLNGDAGDDTLDGGAGRDDLSGGAGNDLLIGGGNDETPVTTVVQELLDGGDGDDTLQTGDGFVALTGGDGTDVFEITRTEVTTDTPVDAFGVRVTEITDLDVATEEVNITFVNGDASNAPVPFTLVDAPDASGVAVMIGGEVYTFLTGVLAADAPTVTVTSAAV